MNNYSSLVAIIAGLNSEWVKRALGINKSRMSSINQKILSRLSAFASPKNDFMHIRSAVASMAEMKPGPSDQASSTKGSAKGKEPQQSGCIPFLG